MSKNHVQNEQIQSFDDEMSAAAAELQKYKVNTHTHTNKLHEQLIINHLYRTFALLMMSIQDLMESADTERSRLLLEKAEADDEKRKAEAELKTFMDNEEKLTDKFKIDFQEVQVHES